MENGGDAHGFFLLNSNAMGQSDVQWNDIDYMDQAKDFTFDPTNFNTLPALVRDLHGHNQTYVMILVWPGLTAFPDFSNEVTHEWWYENLKRFHEKCSEEDFGKETLRDLPLHVPQSWVVLWSLAGRQQEPVEGPLYFHRRSEAQSCFFAFTGIS
ncbi:hypothetical protein XENOCAPTIV_029190 [Xenoophorus captivus]|uniref:Glycoside hydrolase family 31 TIM barrel domain-containing protein n=1 Tax=Xenoophorus captivus TaxID=1517983 RepID=A0ABV0QF49_9TELE